MIDRDVIIPILEDFRRCVDVELSQYDEALHEAVVISIAWDFEEAYGNLGVTSDNFKEFYYRVN